MPKLKESKGNITFKTPFPDEFQRYLCYELENSKKWNPNLVTGGMTASGKWEYKLTILNNVKWIVRWDGSRLIVISQEPKIEIRKGLYFSMGNSNLVIEGHTP